MKKKILSIALVLAGLMGTTAIAQTPSTQDQTQQTGRAEARKADKGRMASPFDGIELNEKQQAELKALREGAKAEQQKLAAEAKAGKKDMKEQRMKDRKEYLAKIKEILTPEQYVQFLENSYLNSQNGRFGMMPGKDGKRGHRDRR